MVVAGWMETPAPAADLEIDAPALLYSSDSGQCYRRD